MNINDDNKINGILMDPDFLTKALNKKDEYGDENWFNIMQKLKYTVRISDALGFDTTVATAIIIGHDIARPCYGEVGEEFVKSHVSDYSKSKYAKEYIGGLLKNVESPKVKQICDGIENVLNQDIQSPEEQIVSIVNKGFEYSQQYSEREARALMMSKYTSLVIKKSGETGHLAQISIPNDVVSPRQKRSTKNTNDIKQKLEANYKYLLENSNKIPKSFSDIFSNLDSSELAAYYIVSKSENFLDKLYKNISDIDKERK